MMKQAVILAAGAGTRIRAVANGTPKCLLPVGGVPLIEHQLRVLRQVGIDRVCVLVGYAADRVEALVGGACECIRNERFANTNSLYSLLLARRWVSGPFVLLNSDVFAHPDIYHRVLAVGGSALAYDSSTGGDAEYMKVCVQNGGARALAKDLPASETSGENVGILQFDAEVVPALFDAAASIISAQGERSWAPAAVDCLAKSHCIRAVDTAGLPWTEIDFPEDLLVAQQFVWPAIASGRWVASMNGPATELKQAS